MTGAPLALLFTALQWTASLHSPPEAEDLPARAVDHVVMLEDGGPPCVSCFEYRGSIIRSGPWVREQWTAGEYHQIHYSDFESGTSFSLLRDRVGGFRGLFVRRGTQAGAPSAFRRQRTGSHDTGLGEPCEIWSITGFRHDAEGCETADGIQLWRRRLDSPRGGIYNSIRAVSVERRPVRRDEARPPPDFFSQIPTLGAVGDADAAAFEVTFLFGKGQERREELFRRWGGRTSGRTQSANGTDYAGTDGLVRFSFEVGADGRPLHLSVWRFAEWERESRRESWAPLPGRRPYSLFGERCTWQKRVEYLSAYQCRTRDGVPLMVQEHPRGAGRVHRALSLKRGPPRPAHFAVPAAAIDWAGWGVEPPS